MTETIQQWAKKLAVDIASFADTACQAKERPRFLQPPLFDLISELTHRALTSQQAEDAHYLLEFRAACSLVEDQPKMLTLPQVIRKLHDERDALARQVEKLSKRVNDLREALVKIRDASPSVAIAEATAKVALGFDEFEKKGETNE